VILLFFGWVGRFLNWLEQLPERRAELVVGVLLLVLPVAGALVWSGLKAIGKAIRRRLRRTVLVRVGALAVRHSCNGHHYIVLPHVTVTNKSSEKQSVGVSLIVREEVNTDWTSQTPFYPDMTPIHGWEQSDWVSGTLSWLFH
jgi:hypothetical protein